MSLVREFQIAVPDQTITDIAGKVAAYPWPAMLDAGGWEHGTSIAFLREVAEYWINQYDWRKAEAELNRYPQYIAEIDGLDVHFYHVKGRGKNPIPLLLLHGWPGSVYEFHSLIGQLSDPVANGDSGAPSFDLVIPSLPGFAFSGKPSQPTGPIEIAALFKRLMVDTLGYQAYVVQGGDWGSLLSTVLGVNDAEHCRGLHLNMIVPGPTPKAETEAEKAWVEKSNALLMIESGYSHVQTTRPQSLAFAMAESPIGVAAWIIEKFWAWSDLPRDENGARDLRSRYSFDHLLTNVMLYLVTNSFGTASWIYRGYLLSAHRMPFAMGQRCETPTAVSAFPDPVFLPPPRSLAEKDYNIVRWTDMPHGGHFAAMEAPDLWLADVRDFFSQIWDGS